MNLAAKNANQNYKNKQTSYGLQFAIPLFITRAFQILYEKRTRFYFINFHPNLMHFHKNK